MKTSQVIDNLIKGNQSMSYEDIYNALIREFFFSSGYVSAFLAKYSEVNIEQLKHSNVKVSGWDSDSGNLNVRFFLEIPEVYWLKPAPEACNSYILSNNLALYYFKSDGCHYNDDIIDSKEEIYKTGNRKYFYWAGDHERIVASQDYPWKVELEVFEPEVDAYVFARLISAEVELRKTKSALANLLMRVETLESSVESLTSKPAVVKPAFGTTLADDLSNSLYGKDLDANKEVVKDLTQKQPQKRKTSSTIKSNIVNSGKTAEFNLSPTAPKKTKMSIQIDADGNIIQTEVAENVKPAVEAPKETQEQGVSQATKKDALEEKKEFQEQFAGESGLVEVLDKVIEDVEKAQSEEVEQGEDKNLKKGFLGRLFNQN